MSQFFTARGVGSVHACTCTYTCTYTYTYTAGALGGVQVCDSVSTLRGGERSSSEELKRRRLAGFTPMLTCASCDQARHKGAHVHVHVHVSRARTWWHLHDRACLACICVFVHVHMCISPRSGMPIRFGSCIHVHMRTCMHIRAHLTLPWRMTMT